MKFNPLKQVLYLALLALPLLSFSFGNDDQHSLFAQGNAWYAKGQYKDALAVYQKVINGGSQSAAVYFNMGNASYKNGDIPSALLYYGKAHKLSPGDEDINFNIQLANLKTTDKIDEAPEFFLAKWWRAFILSFSTGAFAIMSILLFFVGSGLLILYFFSTSGPVKRLSFYSSVTLFVLGVVTVYVASRQVSYFNAHKEAIIFNGAVNIKNSPVNNSNTLFVIHDGTKVNILESSNGWVKIRLPNGNEGWIKAGDAKEI